MGHGVSEPSLFPPALVVQAGRVEDLVELKAQPMQHPEFFVGGAGVESFAGFVQAGTPALAVWGLEGPLKHFWTVDLQVRLDVTRRLVKSLAALAIPDSLRRQRWVPASPGGQHADR